MARAQDADTAPETVLDAPLAPPAPPPVAPTIPSPGAAKKGTLVTKEMVRVSWRGEFIVLRRGKPVSDERFGMGFIDHLKKLGVKLEAK